MDVGGQFSGTVTGVMNMAGALAASFTPLVYGGFFGQRFLDGSLLHYGRRDVARRVDLDIL